MAAQIQFSQGAVTTPVGQSALGYVMGTNVTLTDASGGGATSWLWECVSFPSVLSSPPTITNSTSQVATLTAPTADGIYIIRLTRTDGPTLTSDVRFFGIGDPEYGFILPSAGMTGGMSNVGGSLAAQTAGWQGRQDGGTNVLVDAVLRFLRARAGRFLGLPSIVSFTSSSPSIVTVTDGIDRPWRNLVLTGSALYTEQLNTTVAVLGRRFLYRVSITAGSGGFVLLNGVGGTTLLAISAPPSGTVTYSFEVGFDLDGNWVVVHAGSTDILTVPKSARFAAVSGLQSTTQITPTRIGSVTVDPSLYPANATITFRAALDATTGRSALCKLYNLTDGGVVSGSLLTVSSTTTQFASAVVTLPNSAKDYEVQIQMDATGVAGDHVDCTSAQIILRWG